MKHFVALGLMLLLNPTAQATLPVIDLDAFYFSDAFTYSESKTNASRTFYDVMIGMPLANKSAWVLGWNYDAMKFSDNSGEPTTLSTSEMGPKLVWTANKDRTLSLGVVYNLIARANYNPNTSTSQLRGWSYRIEAAYQPMVTENLFIGIKLNYYHANFNEEVIHETTLAKPSDSRGVIYPTAAITYRFD